MNRNRRLDQTIDEGYYPLSKCHTATRGDETANRSIPVARYRGPFPRWGPRAPARSTRWGGDINIKRREPILQTNTPVYEDAKKGKGEGLHDGESCLS